MERSPLLRAWFAAVAVGALLLVVAVSATEVPGRRATARLFTVDTESVARVVVPVIRFVFLMLVVGALYWWLYTRPTRRRGRGRRKPPSPIVVLLALMLAAAWVVVVGPNLIGDETAVPTTTAVVGTATPGTLDPSAEDGVAPLGRPDWGLWVLVALGIGAVGYVIVSRRQIARPSPWPLPALGEAAAVPEPPGGTDPAGRVFAAYRRVEEASSRNDMGRSPAETVGSHLGRLGPVTEAASAAGLAVIYHRARFSTHEIAEESAEAAEDDGRRIMSGLGE